MKDKREHPGMIGYYDPKTKTVKTREMTPKEEEESWKKTKEQWDFDYSMPKWHVELLRKAGALPKMPPNPPSTSQAPK